MYFCILCSKQGVKKELFNINAKLTGSLTIADSIEIYFPFITILTDELHKICLECHSVLKNFHELLDNVKLMYEFQDLPMVKCEALDPDPVTSEEMIYEPELKIEIKEEKYVLKDLTVVLDSLDIPKGKRTLSYLETSQLRKAKKQKLNESRKSKEKKLEESDEDFIPSSLKPRGKPGRPRLPTYDGDQLKYRKELRAEQDARIRQYVDVRCFFCKLPFQTFSEVHQHFVDAHPEYSKNRIRKAFLVCCGKRFNMRSSLLDHIKTHIVGSGFICDLCPKKNYISKDAIRNHMKESHMGDQTPANCPVCSKTFRNEKLMKRHLPYHEVDPDKTFQCYKCEKIFNTLHHLRYHFGQKHPLKYKGASQFAKLMPKNFICEICAKTFNEKKKFTEHTRLHTERQLIAEGKGFKCEQCPRVFGSRYKLVCHVKIVHTARDPVICHICSKELKTLNNLELHVRAWHTENLPRLECPICHRFMKHETSLAVHLRKHKEHGKDYKCKQCDHVSKSKGGLWSHVNYVHKLVRNIPCSFCSKMFKTDLDRKEHEATHTGIDLYQCEFCPKTFKFGASYRGHKIREHPNEYEVTKPVWMAKGGTKNNQAVEMEY